jgi:hypothetical protein
MGVFFGLFDRVRHGDDNVAEQLRAGVVVNVVHAVNTQRERQHIRRHILVAVLMIQAADFLIVHKTDADFRGTAESLVDKHRRAATAHEHTHARGDFNLFWSLVMTTFTFSIIVFFWPPRSFRML